MKRNYTSATSMKPITTAISRNGQENNAIRQTTSNNSPPKPTSTSLVPEIAANEILTQKHPDQKKQVQESKVQEPINNSSIDKTITDEHVSKKGQERFPIRLVLVLPVILGLILIVYLYYPSGDNSATDKQNIAAPQSDRLAPEKELEKIANQLIESNNRWNSEKVNSFVLLWNSIAKPIRQDLADTAWYKHFTFVLETKLKEISNQDSYIDPHVGDSNDPILTLAFTLDVVKSNQYFTNRRSQKKNFKKLLAKIQSEISKADSAKQQDSSNEASSPFLNDALRQEFEISPAGKKTNTQKPATSKSKSRINNPDPAIAITGDKIRTLIAEYKNAYQAGNFNRMQALFLVNENRGGSTLVSDLLDSYHSTFNNSESRSVNFSDLEWRYSGDVATGTGQYKADITLPDSHGTQTINASAVIKLQMLESELKIASVILNDKNVTASNPNTLTVIEPEIEEMPFLATPNVPVLPKAPTQPTSSELQNIVERFVNAYESGNIDLLVSVLSQDIKTNDKFSLKEIKQDYVDLFAKSSKRKMLIGDMKWQFQKNHAKGTGNLSAIITTNNAKQKENLDNVVKGKIQIIAKRINGEIFITHLYHLEHNQ